MIKLENIVKNFDTPNGTVNAIKGISLEIKRGEIFGIIGLSGAGKSTLVRCINLLERPTSGTVTVDGKELTKMTDAELRDERKSISMIFQHFNLLSSATVYDNIAFPLRLVGTDEAKIKEKVNGLLELVSLSDKADVYPAQLSGGQKQRVGIARALASEPKVLLCDEATSALDPQTTKSILDLILEINKKMSLTVVVITHEMAVIKDICDRVAVIDGGVIKEEGLVVDVLTNPQESITKELTSSIFSRELPPSLKDKPVSESYFDGAKLLARLTFLGETANDAILAAAIRQFPADISILYGLIGDIKTVPFGRMLVSIEAAEETIDPLLEYLKERILTVEVVGYVA